MKCHHFLQDQGNLLLLMVQGIWQLCKIILNLDQWFRRRCHLKDFLSGALVALEFGGAEPFMQFW